MRPLIPELKKNGATVAVIGVGATYFAKGFDDEFGLSRDGAQVLTDPSRKVFDEAGMKRGAFRTFNPAGLFTTIGTLARGHRQRGVKGDPWQQGGALVIRKGGEIVFQHNDPAPGEQVDLKKLLEATLAAS